MTGLVLYSFGRIDTRTQLLLVVLVVDFGAVAWVRRSLRVVFSFEGSSTSSMPKTWRSVFWVEEKMGLNCRFALVSLRILVEMSARRRGWRE